ncbi:TonB-dependent receptor [Piscinibacter sp.]|jgi:iron complex outermembrane receptor protein|uniref:TonB-dependent receptor domain-containing protein n=1 Tax=Piscinibacter sp. TaxID=1903157 RepID=UPI001D3B020E|nr:TonB-dependent receptor [Piscinibacter sp.]MBK7529819.1 TonB-dependent receptor [Piscinibacter sp.]
MFRRTKVCSAVLVAFGGTLALGAAPAFGQQTLDRVEITGSSIKRIDVEGSLPVQTVTREDIERSGVTSTEQLLQSITAASSAGGTANATGAGSSTYGLATISLHGLGEERTLVLVNGRRLAIFANPSVAAVNVNVIPLAAIERVEVVKDGASGVYGSDAIAGVVNFILKKDYQGLELNVSTGTPTRDGGGQNHGVSVVGGIGNLQKDRYSITFSASLEKDFPLFAKDRKFAATGNQFPYIVSGATGQGNIEGAYTPGVGPQAGFGGSPGTGYGNPLAASDTCETINMFLNPTPSNKGAPYCTFDSNTFVGLLPKRDLLNLTANGAVKVNDAVELFGDVLFSKSTVTQRFQPSPVRRSFLLTDGEFANQGVDPALLISPGNPNYQIAADYLNANGFGALVGQPLAVTARVFDFGLRTSEDENEQTRLVVGSRGTLFGLDYEVAAAHNESKTSGTVPDGYFSQVAFARVVNAPGSDWNPWSLTQSAAFNAALAAAGAKYTGGTIESKSTADGIDGKITGELGKLAGGTVQYALGAAYRQEKLQTTPSAALGTGDIAGLGGATAPVDVKRKVASVFAELLLPISKTLEGTLAVRGDKYSIVGDSTNYKAALSWRPNQTFLVRGSVGTSFRAPSLIDLYTPVTLGTSEQFDDPFTGETDLQVNALNGGKSDLKPEKSQQETLGIVFQPTPNFSAAVDLFNVRVKDYIQTPSAQLIVSRFRAGDPAYANLVTLDGSGSVAEINQLLSNTGGSTVRGLDVDLRYSENVADGKFSARLFGTYMLKFDETTPSGAISHRVGTIVDPAGNPVSGADNGGVVLRWKHALTGTYSTGAWAFTATQNFASGYEAGRNAIDNDRNFIPSFSTYDANITYTGIKNLRLAIGARNLFDKNPPGVFTPVSNQFQGGYDITQYDPRGRFVYVAAGYKFW